MRQFKALMQIPEGSVDDELILAVYYQDQALGSLGHCTIKKDGPQYMGCFELTDDISETCRVRFLGYVDASNGLFVPERILMTSVAEDEEALPLSALILDDVPDN